MGRDFDPTTSSTHPCLKHTLIIPKGMETIQKLTSEDRILTPEWLTKSHRGEVDIFSCWSEFEDGCTLKQIKGFADKYGVTFTSKMNKVDASLAVWHAMCNMANDATATRVRDPQGKKVGKLANRIYVRVDEDELTDAELKHRNDAKLPPQALACLRIFLGEGTKEVTEIRMRELIEEQRGKLNTRQDPWRIFQYYRPQLIGYRYMRLV